MRYRYLLALTLSVAALPALAHDPLPVVSWCSTGRAVPVAEFDFSPQTLKAFRRCEINRRGGNPPGAICALLPIPGNGGNEDDMLCPPNQCGEFDDDYHVAKIAASNYCNAVSTFHREPSGVPGNFDHVVIPLFSNDAPAFNAIDHHSAYSLDKGIRGTCMACLLSERNNPTQ